MSEFSAYFYVAFNKAIISKLDLCEGGTFSTAIFYSDIHLSVYFFSCFISACPFVDLLKETYVGNSHIVLSSRY